jgi:hypothetical protein
MSEVLSKRKCPTCAGSGKEFDRKALNKFIHDLNMNLQDVAAALEISPSYLAKLMHDPERKWHPEMVEKLLGLKKAV